MPRDNPSTCCHIGIKPTLEGAVREALEKFNEKVSRERGNYIFSATDIRVRTFRERLFFKKYMVELWFDRLPRDEEV